MVRQVVRYLNDRNRSLKGGWVSVADLRGVLGLDVDETRSACLALHGRGLAELMGGFPIRPTTDNFTLVRLSDEGVRVAGDPSLLDQHFGAADSTS